MKTLQILSIGNSFSVDTMHYLAPVALHAGYDSVHIGILYVGGCSVRKHYYHAQNDLAVYEYHTDGGDGWSMTPQVSIAQAVTERKWDVINIQQGTLDGTCYANIDDYADLPALIAYVRERANPDVRISFNMTWVGEPDFAHHEIVKYGGDTQKLFADILSLTKRHIIPMDGVDVVSPTGLAIQYARAQYDGKLTRDGFHLSWGFGRLTAAVTFFTALTGTCVTELDYLPDGVTKTEKDIALSSAAKAQDWAE